MYSYNNKETISTQITVNHIYTNYSHPVLAVNIMI